jgi:hypothetical protein
MSSLFSWILLISFAWSIHAWVNRMTIRSLQDEVERNKPPF